MPKIITREQWESIINEAGADRYEFVKWAAYDKFGSKHKCVVRCHNDGYEWNAKVDNLVNKGNGCPHCAGKRRWTAEERIEHINKLESIEFVSWVGGYKNHKSKANVRCEIDGYEWSADVDRLVNIGRGCPHCSGKRRWTSEERIKQVNELDGVEFVSWVGGYENHKSKANVRCKIDGFEWSADVNHLVNHGTGCPKCSKSGYDKSKTGALYAIRSECGRYLKVGISNNPSIRHKQLEKRTPFKFNLIEQISGDGAKIAELEKYFHSKYERAGFARFDGCTEWLICTPQLLEELRELEDVK